jgi:ribosomal protein L9
MSRILVAIVAAGIAFGSSAGFAADAAKSPELTKEERAEMRNRAEQLTAQRARMPMQADTAVGTTHKATTHKATTHKATTHKATKHKVTKHKATKPAKGMTPAKSTTPAVKKGEQKV